MSYTERLEHYIRVRVGRGTRPNSKVIEEMGNFAQWLDGHSKPQRACPLPTREGDEYLCRACLLRWPADEDKPDCRA